MKKLDEIDQINLEEIEEEIKTRRNLIDQMVGTLYPQILWGEIDKLKEWKKEAIVKRGSVGFEK